MNTNLEHLEPRLFLSGDPILAPQIVDNGGPNFKTTGTWSNSTTGGYQNNFAVTSGSSATATWTFHGLTPGYQYRISSTWVPGSTRSNDAVYTVTDHLNNETTRVLATESLNQRQAPDDFSADGAMWEDVGGLVTVRGTTLTVTVQGSLSGSTVADAVRIERVGTWQAPIGTPTPSFGIEQSHWMYAAPAQRFDYGQGLEPYKIGAHGPYTHYIDNTHSNATDSNNPLGTPDRPRLTVPTGLPAGSVVELHGGPYSYGGTTEGRRIANFNGTGTAARPIFIRGADRMNRTTFVNSQIRVSGQYIIVEDLILRDSQYQNRNSPSHIAVRNVDQFGFDRDGFGTAMFMGGTDIVLYNSQVHDNGKLDVDYQHDIHGVTFHGNRLWVVDNVMYRNAGDAVQINGTADTARNVFLSRNVMHHDRENAVDIKGSRDVVVAQNIMYGYRPAPASDGTAIVGGHEGSQRSWFLFNEIYDSANAIRINDSAYRTEAYVIGNVMYDLSGYGVITWFSNDVHVVNNTFWNVRDGFSDGSWGNTTAAYQIHNNIFGRTTGGNHLKVSNRGTNAANSSMSNNLFFQPNGSMRAEWNGQTYTTVNSMINGTGKGQGSIEAHPNFVDVAAEDFRLQAHSPAIDAGTSIGQYVNLYKNVFGVDLAMDINSTPRPQGKDMDMGAYEYTLAAVTPTPPPPTNSAPVASNLSIQTERNKAVSGQVAATDADGDALTFSLVGQPSNGTVSMAADGKFTYTPPSNWTGQTSFTFRASDGKDVSNTATVSIAVVSEAAPVPGMNWANQDVGPVAAAGSTSFDSTSGVFTVKGSGHDIGKLSDSFQFAYQALEGDGQIVARVMGVENTYHWAKAGVMFREGLTGESRNVLMAITPEMGSTFQYRTNTGEGTDYVDPLCGTKAPQWVKLIRQGDTFTGFHSADGISWIQIGSTTLPMGQTLHVGLAVSSLNDGVINTSQFTNVVIRDSVEPTLIGDVNGDGKVDSVDLGILLGNWGKTGATWQMGDLTGSGTVGSDDLSLLLNAWARRITVSDSNVVVSSDVGTESTLASADPSQTVDVLGTSPTLTQTIDDQTDAQVQPAEAFRVDVLSPELAEVDQSFSADQDALEVQDTVNILSPSPLATATLDSSASDLLEGEDDWSVRL